MTCPDALEKGRAGELSTANEVAVPLLKKPTKPMPPTTGWITMVAGFGFMVLGLFAMRDGDLSFGLLASLMGVAMAVGGFFVIEFHKRRTEGRDFDEELALWGRSDFCDNCGTRFCGDDIFEPPVEPKLFSRQQDNQTQQSDSIAK